MNCRHDNESSDMKPRDNNPPKHARNNSQLVFPVFSTSKALKENKSNYTHPVAFNFKCEERAERRKEFNLRLEEKNKAKEEERKLLLEKAKIEFEAEIRELRRSLVFKANPVPSFYREAAIPAKVKMNKIPPKSSEFRRRSRSEGGAIIDQYCGVAREYGNGMGSKASSSSSCKGGGYAKLRVRHGSCTSFGGSHDEDVDGTPSSHQTNNMESNYGNTPYHDHQDNNNDDDDCHDRCRVEIQ